MKKYLIVCVVVLCWCHVGLAAPSVGLYVDSFQNEYGSDAPDNYTYYGSSFEAAAFQGAADGTFVNMSHSINPANSGTTNFDVMDEIVYSFGDTGKRLHWVFWIDGESVSSLNGRWSTQLENWFDGSYYASDWSSITQLSDYDSDHDGSNDGVVGIACFGWVGGATSATNQTELDGYLSVWDGVSESWRFTVTVDGADTSITSNLVTVPAPGALVLGSLGTALLGWRRRKG